MNSDFMLWVLIYHITGFDLQLSKLWSAGATLILFLILHLFDPSPPFLEYFYPFWHNVF